MNDKSEKERIAFLVNTSVDDMQSSLWAYDDVRFLRKALAVVRRRGEKTKVRILTSKIKRLEKENASSNASSNAA